MEKRVYKNLAIISIMTAILTSIVLSSLFYDFYRSSKLNNLEYIAKLSANTLKDSILEDSLDKDISIQIYKANSLPSEDSSILYYDLYLNDSQVFRVSQPAKGIGYIILTIVPIMASLIVFILIILYIVSSLITKNLIAPLKTISKNMESILSGEVVQYPDTYDELTPLIRNMDIHKKETEYYINRLKKTERMRREFTANVSHELKTPLTSINGFAEMIETGIVKGDDAIKSASIIHKEGLRLLELIDSIIQLSKLEDLSIQMDFSSIDLFGIAKSILAKLEYAAKERNISLKISGKTLVIQANQRMIEDLIFNLIDNAIKYNVYNGSIDIDIFQEDRWAVFKITDTGIGIPTKDQDRIFERFYMVDKSRSKKISGTGLGLSIVKHIVEYHDGNLSLFSAENKGTTLEIRLPK